MKIHRRQGFTLIELSIVLVIIGLIVGGILIGKDMIEAAQLRNIQKDVDMLSAAVNTFKAKYNCLPGDCPNATNFFPAGNCDGSVESSTAVCNGDGDGVIGGDGPDADIWWFHQWENYYFWRTLNAAGMIPFIIPESGYTMPAGTWMGVLDNSSTARGSWPNSVMYITNTYVAGQIDGVGWGNLFMPADYTNALIYSQLGASGLGANGEILTSVQAQSIDTKFDDGMANTGRIIAGSYPYGACAPAASAAPVAYPSTNTGVTCGLIYLKLF